MIRLFLKCALRVSLVMSLLLSGCAHKSELIVESGTVAPGSKVTRGGQPIPLYPGNIRVGDNIASQLKELGVDAGGKVAIIAVVPSIDTPVCEAQSHQLSETGGIHPAVARIVVSRDTSMAQQRFLRESRLSNLRMGSDFRTGDFGKRTGLMMQGSELLARGYLVVDKLGVVAYLQIVPEITSLPDLNRAIEIANKLVE